MFQAESLACRRGRQLVFRDVGFTLKPGDLLRVTGPNGSGKSSLLRMLAGLLPGHDGTLSWQGKRITDFTAHRAHLRYLGHHDALKPELTVGESIRYWRLLDPRAEGTVPAELGIDSLEDKPVKVLSAGQKRRVALARLALGFVPLWLLDEPATALDEAGQKILARLLADHRARGGMAVVATHHALTAKGARDLVLGAA